MLRGCAPLGPAQAGDWSGGDCGYPPRMRIGTSIGMIAVGLILALAVPFDLGTINLQLVGWILAVVGLLGLIASVAISRRAVVSRREVYPPDERF